jgi:hypothetical protein
MGEKPGAIQNKLKTMPPASLSASSPERIKTVVKNPKIMEKIEEMNPDMGKNKNTGKSDSGKYGTSDIADF